MLSVTQEEINRNIQEVNEKIDVAIFNSKGCAVSFEYQPSKCKYMKYIKTSLWGKKSFELSGEGIVLSKAIIATLPSGILGQEVLQIRTASSGISPEHGNVKIQIEISGGYARNRYDSLYVKNIASIVNGIKQHKDIVDTLAQYIKSIDIHSFLINSSRVRIYSNGIWDYDGECQGNQGIAFNKLGMSNLDTVESQYALAIVLVDWLNNELKEDGKTYYAVADYNSWHKHCICIRVNAVNSPKSNMKSWY